MSKIINKIKNSNENTKNVINNIVNSFIIKGLSILLMVFTVPAYIRYFNDNTALGLWYTLLSVLSWVLNFDLGIGNGLRNKLTEALAKNDKETARKYISVSYFSFGVIIAVIIIIFSVIFNYINWNTVFNIKSNVVSSEVLLSSIKIIFIGIMLQFFLRLISSILYALQLSSVNNIVALISTIINFIYISIAPSASNDINLYNLAIVHTFSINIPLIIITVIIFLTKLKGMTPSLSFLNFSYMNLVLKLGGKFFFLQIVYMLIVNTNEYLIILFSQADDVVNYQIYHKLFTLIGTVFTLALTPIWSAVTKALTEKNYLWIKSLYKKMYIIAFIGSACEYLLIIFLQFGINIWLKDAAITVNYGYALCFATLGTLMIYTGVFSSIANGISKVEIQLITYSIGFVIKIPIAYICTRLLDSWIGVVIGCLVSMTIYIIVQPIYIKKYMNSWGD